MSTLLLLLFNFLLLRSEISRSQLALSFLVGWLYDGVIFLSFILFLWPTSSARIFRVNPMLMASKSKY